MQLSVWDPLVLLPLFEPWTDWFLPDLHGFYKWVLDACSLLNEFVIQVVRGRQASGIQAWSDWIRQDLSSHPKKMAPSGLRPSGLVCKPAASPSRSGILVHPALIDAHFRKAWMPYFRREGHPVVSPQVFLDFVGHHLLQEAFLEMPVLTGEDRTMQQWPRIPQLMASMGAPGMR